MRTCTCYDTVPKCMSLNLICKYLSEYLNINDSKQQCMSTMAMSLKFYFILRLNFILPHVDKVIINKLVSLHLVHVPCICVVSMY